MTDAWPIPTDHFAVNEIDAPVTHGWHLGKRRKIGDIGGAEHKRLIPQKKNPRGGRRPFFGRDVGGMAGPPPQIVPPGPPMAAPAVGARETPPAGAPKNVPPP